MAGSEIAVTAFHLHERVMAMNGRPDRGSLPGALRSYEFPVIGKGRRKILGLVQIERLSIVGIQLLNFAVIVCR